MSIVAHGGFALVPSASSPEGLTKRLLALRAEIDAILVELVSHAMANPQQETTMPGMTVAPAILRESSTPTQTIARVAVEQTSDPGPVAPRSHQMPRPESCDVAQAEAACEPAVASIEPAGSLGSLDLIPAAAPQWPIADAVAPESLEDHEQAPLSRGDEPAVLEDVGPHVAEPLPAAEAGGDGTEHLHDGSPTLETPLTLIAEASPLAPATELAARDQHDDIVIAAMLDESKPPAEGSVGEPHAEQAAALADTVPLAALLPTSPAENSATVAPVATVESHAEATVIDFRERQRKQAELKASSPMGGYSRPVRAGRRLATKIAASILLLITAATAMVASDRNAFGMAQSLPWMTQAPSTPSTFVWLLKRFKDGMARASEAGRQAWGG
jgi:hypothetical protein